MNTPSQAQFHAEIMSEQEQEEAAQDAEMAYYFAMFKAEKASAPEDCGYDLNDPKHPTWLERQVEAADFARDQAKDASYDKWLDAQESKHE